ncbi:MAG: LPXTG cell wall anchor domain-containing protein [bacterium]|nr:LPXTG cell wall anchor domain-containing protein [bacterium]
MKRSKVIFIAAVLALVSFLSVGTASAQGQSATANPSTVPEPGTYDITVTAEGFTLPSVNFAICSTGDVSNISDGLPSMMQYCGGLGEAVELDGGSYTTTESVEVTDAGVTFMFFELAAGGESTNVSVNIGELADTGVNTSLLVVIGLSIALAGVMLFGLSRRLRSVQ